MSDMLELLAGMEKIKTVKSVFSPLSLFSLTEMDTSRLLAFFLDPQGKHGAGTAFLRRFQTEIDCDGRGIQFVSFPFVVPEAYLGESGRADVLISDEESGCAILIENKLMGANDGEKQLERYGNWLEKNAPKGYVMVYLSEYLPTEWSISSKSAHWSHLVQMSPGQFADNVLGPVAESLNGDYAVFAKFVADYLKNIGMTREDKEVMDLIVQHYASAARIYDQFDFVRKQAFEHFQIKLKEKLGNDFDVEFYERWKSRGCPQLLVKVRDGTDKPWGVDFGFEGVGYKDFYYGVRWFGDMENTEEKQLFEAVRKQGIRRGGRTDFQCWSWYVYENPPCSASEAVINSPKYIREMLKDEDNGFIEWAAEVVKRICEEVRQAQEQVKSGFAGCK